MALFENFPYSDMHQLNLDWIIKIAKDFLDQYTTIQQVISDGQTSLDNTITSGISQLDTKADEIETLLNEWYNTHSEDIANQLASALSDLNTWYNTHLPEIAAALTNAINSFNTAADAKAATTIASIPDDYTTLYNQVQNDEKFALGTPTSFDIPTTSGVNVYSYTIRATNTYMIINTSATGPINVKTSNDNSGSPVVEDIANVSAGIAYVFKPTLNATYLRIYHDVTQGVGSFTVIDCSGSSIADLYRKITAINKYIYNEKTPFTFILNNAHIVHPYQIIAGHTYIIKNTGSNFISLYSYSSDTYGSGSRIETMAADVGPGRETRFTASYNASYVEGLQTPYTTAGSAIIYDANTIEQKIDDAENPPTTTDILFWGDSITAGAGGSGVTFPAVCAAFLGGYQYLNCGVGGESANSIACRQGGNCVRVPAAINGTFATLYDYFIHELNFLKQGDGAGSAASIIINGVECNISWNGSAYVISGYTGDASLFPRFGRLKGAEYTAKVHVIFVGQNGAFANGISGIDAYTTIIDSMIGHCNNNNYVIMGLSTGTAAERNAMETEYLKKYGNKFFNTRHLLVSYGLGIAEITPTAQDQTDIASGIVPTSLRYDETHLNMHGYRSLGILLADKINSLGYLK